MPSGDIGMSFNVEVDFEQWATHLHDYYDAGSRTETEFKLTRSLVLASRRWTTHIDKVVGDHTGLSRAQWNTLSALTFLAEPVAVVHLSRLMGIKWPTLVRVLKTLENQALISRGDSEADRRSTLVAITESGRRRMAEVQKVLDPERSATLEKFTDDEIVTAARVLDELFRAMVSRIPEE